MISARISASLRREVRERAGERCEYCLMVESEAIFPHEPDHFELRGSLIIPLTPIGRVTVKLLQLNLGSRVEVRERLVAINAYPGKAN